MRQALTAAFVAGLRMFSAVELAGATSIEAGSFMNVTVDAPLYDTSLAAGGGCDPAGCDGSLTRDGGMTPTSRWSCSTSLGEIGSLCSITYTLANVSTVEALQVAMYKGDSRIVSVDIFVDEVKEKSWTSSGTITSFERIELGATGETIELRGVLAESEWLSIIEVEIMVLQDGCTPAPSSMPTLADTPMAASTGDSYMEVPATLVPSTPTPPSSTVAPSAAQDTIGAPTPTESHPTSAQETVEPTLPGDRDANLEVATVNGVPGRFSGGFRARTVVGSIFGVATALLS